MILLFACFAAPILVGAEEQFPPKSPLTLVPIAAGIFEMGSEKGYDNEKPVHKVNLTKAFYMGATEITQATYKAVMSAAPSHCKGDDLPVENISWDDAERFCTQLTKSEAKKGNLSKGMEYRLPSEAEWEYCCRAGSTTEYCFGDDAKLLVEYAWGLFLLDVKTHPVGKKKQNAWGLYDMHGNVDEWCRDWYASGYPEGELSDPGGPLKGDNRVVRGGMETYGGDPWRSACRSKAKPDLRSDAIGFRVVAAPAPGEPFRPVKNTSFALVEIQPGSFLMGSNRYNREVPVHRVTISRALYMGATEVTQGQYRVVMNTNPSNFKGDDLPVETTNWLTATEFCRRLTESERKKGNLQADMEYRLPTEAEWEYCCRAGTTTEYNFGADTGLIGDYAWYCANSDGRTHPVGKKKPNAWGLHDMYGNVSEWCFDWYAADYQANDQTDPLGPATGEFRVLRGGSYDSVTIACRSAGTRAKSSPDWAHNDCGFRVVLAAVLVRN